jgi:hypothetical protein
LNTPSLWDLPTSTVLSLSEEITQGNGKVSILQRASPMLQELFLSRLQQEIVQRFQFSLRRSQEDDSDARAVDIIRRTIQQRLVVGTNVGTRALERYVSDEKAPRPDLVVLALDKSSSAAAFTRMLDHVPEMTRQLSCPILILSSSKAQAKPSSPSAHTNRATPGDFFAKGSRVHDKKKKFHGPQGSNDEGDHRDAAGPCWKLGSVLGISRPVSMLVFLQDATREPLAMEAAEHESAAVHTALNSFVQFILSKMPVSQE